MYTNVFKGAPMGNKNAAGPHFMGGGRKPDGSAYGTQQAFAATSRHFKGSAYGGGPQGGSNVTMHRGPNAEANRLLHEGAMHAHLQDSGYTKGETRTDGSVHSTDYHNAKTGDRVTLNAGVSGGRNYVGYTHSSVVKP